VGVDSSYILARSRAYDGAARIHFDGIQYRTDIAAGL
jgi:phosphoribosylamine-glycine ligase